MDTTQMSTTSAIIEQLNANYSLLPEASFSISKDSSTLAAYTQPTERYRHGILGDRIEAGQLVVVINGVFFERTLSTDYVFEDIRPRLADVDHDGKLEFITIRTHVQLGGGIAIYKIENDQLIEYAHVEEIGIPNRWLNPVIIHDLDQDGTVELAWIQTPHIGGILKIAKIQPGKLKPLDETQFYSNHGIGERNLCLSVLTEENEKRVFYVPSQGRDQLVGFSFQDNQLVEEVRVDQEVDFGVPLIEQYGFEGVVVTENNCINPD